MPRDGAYRDTVVTSQPATSESIFPHVVPLSDRERGGVSGLPASLTPLVGRAEEVEALVALLCDPTIRLVTLTGPGGVGKTRLAMAAAAEAADQFAEGVAFVALAAVTDPAFVAPTVVRALGIEEIGDHQASNVLARALATRQLLLTLDNLEHLIEAGPLLTGLLAACPNLTILATSRTRLHLSGERDISVARLALPEPASSPEAASVMNYGAIRLWVERSARAGARPGRAAGDSGRADRSGQRVPERRGARGGGSLSHRGAGGCRRNRRPLVHWPCVESSGHVAAERGDWSGAISRYEHSLRIWRELGDDARIALTLDLVGWTYFLAGNLPRSWDHYTTALSLFFELEYEPTLAQVKTLAGIACIAGASGAAAAAVRLVAAGEALRGKLHLPIAEPEERILAIQRARWESDLGSAAYAKAWLDGSKLDDLVALAEARTVPKPTVTDGLGLSPRERDVLRLLVEGASDPEIAERLYISRRTASNHVHAILTKLGVSSRSAAAALAVRHGLD